MLLIAVTAMVQLLNAQFVLDCGSYDDFDARFRKSGKFHNAHLENIARKFEEPKDINDYESAINYIKNINDNYFKANQDDYLGSDVQSPGFVAEVSESCKYYVNSKEFKEQLVANEGAVSLMTVLNKVKEVNMLDNANYLLFSKNILLVRATLLGQNNAEEFEAQLRRLANDWLKVNQGKEDAEAAFFTGSIISIGLKSCQFWRENESLLDTELNRIPTQIGPEQKMVAGKRYFIPPVVALDAAGALVSAAAVSLNQYVNTGHIRPGIVATGAVIGAVTASTGLVGKVAKWITSLF